MSMIYCQKYRIKAIYNIDKRVPVFGTPLAYILGVRQKKLVAWRQVT